MKRLLRALLSPKSAGRPSRQARPELEVLEAREVPTVTNLGGAVLGNVQVQALFLGSDWVSNSTYYNQSRTLDNFLGGLVSGSYMDMLHNAGYGVGRGNFYGGNYLPWGISKTQYLTDSTIRNDLSLAISNNMVLPPVYGGLNGNNLYVVFVEDNVAVQNDSSWDSTNNRYDNSVQDFAGYHTAYYGGFYNTTFNYGYGALVHYVVMPYAGGSVPLSSGTASNGQWSYLSTLDSMTMVASHEVAEAVTDPNIGYSTKAWYDTSLKGEIGDVANARTVYLNGYAVQRIADQNDQPMTPAGATAVTPTSFVLTSNGNLYVGSGSSLSIVTGGVASISDQSIDDYGHAMIDVVFRNGYASEYHAGLTIPWIPLDSNVKMAKAGQGVSYLLYNDGTVKEYKDWDVNAYPAASRQADTFTGAWYKIDTSGAVVSIDAGTDRYGVSMMTEVWSYNPASYTYGFEVSDSTGWNWLDWLNSTISTISAGQQGNIGILYQTAGTAVWYSEANNSYTTEGWNVTQFTMGTDERGGVQFDMLYGNGTFSQYSQADGWKSASIYQWIGKAHAGWVEGISGGTAWNDFLGAGQWQWQGDGAVAAA